MSSSGFAVFISDCSKRVESGPSEEHFHYFSELLALHDQFFGEKCPEVMKRTASSFITMYGNNPKFKEDPKLAFAYYLMGRYSRSMSVDQVMRTLYDNDVLGLARKNAAQPAKLIEKIAARLLAPSPILKNLAPPSEKKPQTERTSSHITASVRKSLSTPPPANELKTPKGTPKHTPYFTPKTSKGVASIPQRIEISKQTQKDANKVPDVALESKTPTFPTATSLQPDNMRVQLHATNLPETRPFFHHRSHTSKHLDTSGLRDSSDPLKEFADEKENSGEEHFVPGDEALGLLVMMPEEHEGRRMSGFQLRRKSLAGKGKNGRSFGEKSMNMTKKPATHHDLQKAIDDLCLNGPSSTSTWKAEPQKNPFKL
ncbi:unnamed protein product, partial [Mesorhabditis spiculigera]